MTDLAHARAAFEEYLNQFCREDEKIRLKIVHTEGVVRCAAEICRRMELGEEDCRLAELIALLHDIGRFEQARRFDSFEPSVMDHAAYGVDLLFGSRQMIRRFTEENTWDDIIREAILRHSRYEVGDGMDSRTLLHARLIRDADKLDNCRVKLEDPLETFAGGTAEEIGAQKISPKVKADVLAGKCIRSSDRVTLMDFWVSYVAYFYDLNFRESLDIVEEQDYVRRIVGRIPYSAQETEHAMEEIERALTAYVQTHGRN